MVLTFNKIYFFAYLPDQFLVQVKVSFPIYHSLCLLSHYYCYYYFYVFITTTVFILSVIKSLIMIIITISITIFTFTYLHIYIIHLLIYSFHMCYSLFLSLHAQICCYFLFFIALITITIIASIIIFVNFLL